MGILAAPPQSYVYPPSNKGSIAGLIKGNQWVFYKPLIRPAISGGVALGGVARIPMNQIILGELL